MPESGGRHWKLQFHGFSTWIIHTIVSSIGLACPSCIRCMVCACFWNICTVIFYCTAVMRKRASSPLRPHAICQPEGHSLQAFGRGRNQWMYIIVTRQDKTRQDKTRQDKTRQDKTRQDKTRQDKLSWIWSHVHRFPSQNLCLAYSHSSVVLGHIHEQLPIHQCDEDERILTCWTRESFWILFVCGWSS